MAAFRGPPRAGIRAHRSRHCVRADLCDRIRARTDGGCAGDCDPLHRRARQTVFRDRRECRHETGRRRAIHWRELGLLHAFCRVAAGGGRLRQLRSVALRNQCPGSFRDGFRRRRRHRLDAQPTVRQGCANMTQLPTPDPESLRARYPEVFNRPISARLATPAMMLVASGIFIFGLIDLDFSPARLLSGLHQLGWITLMMIPPDPGTSLPAYLVALGETLSIALVGTTI